MLFTELPDYVLPAKAKIEAKLRSLGMWLDINHVLVNEYKPGDGIMAHTDGPAYVPIVATITTGGAQTLLFRDRCSRSVLHRVYLEPGSLAVLHSDLYSELHEIEAKKSDAIGPFLSNFRYLSIQTGTYSGTPSPIADANSNLEFCRSTRVSFTFRQVKNVKKLPKFLRLKNLQ